MFPAGKSIPSAVTSMLLLAGLKAEVKLVTVATGVVKVNMHAFASEQVDSDDAASTTSTR
jgi:hypothetical protein